MQKIYSQKTQNLVVYKIMKQRFFIISLSLFCLFAYGQNAKTSYKTLDLLSAYLSSDLELKKTALSVKEAELSSQQSTIQNGISATLSTGTITFKNINDSLSVEFSPEAKISVPAAANLTANVSSQIKINEEANAEKTRLSLSVDIISSKQQERKNALLKSDRAVTEAKRTFQDNAISAEKNFYTELKKLYNTASSIISSQNDLYDDTITFEEIKAQGYTKSSSKYRSAELRVLSDKRTVETKQRELEHDCVVFASKCGITLPEEFNPFDFLPSEIPQVKPVSITSFDMEDYKKIEQAKWNYYINELDRNAEKDFSLSANTGYTFNNTDTNSDTADIGTNLSWKGLSVGMGISIPTTQEKSPAYTISASVDPNTFRLNKIKKQKNDISSEKELITIEDAIQKYETSLVDQQTSLNDIIWSKETNLKTYQMYSELESDLGKWYKAGITKESEYLSAKTNKEKYKINLLINDIDLIIYNIETNLLFNRDEK